MNEGKVLIDNWMLQEVAELLVEGINVDTTIKYIIENENKSKRIKVPHSAIQLESLFKLLTEVVTSEELFLDGKFAHAWQQNVQPLDNLEQKKIVNIIGIPKTEKFIDNREIIIEHLKLSKDLRRRHESIVKYWDKHQKNKNDKDGFLSQVIWGTAGNLSRSGMLNMLYSPHPTRTTLIEGATTPFKLNATEEILSIIQNKRIELIERIYSNSKYNIGTITLNPIIVEIIESANSVNNMFSVALQLRKDYKNFRKFINKYQAAINNGDTKKLLESVDLINEVSSRIINKNEFNKYGEIELNLVIGKIKGKFDVIRNIRSNFGVRATIKKFLFAKHSEGTLDKIFELFDEKNIKLKNEIKEYFIVK